MTPREGSSRHDSRSGDVIVDTAVLAPEDEQGVDDEVGRKAMLITWFKTTVSPTLRPKPGSVLSSYRTVRAFIAPKDIGILVLQDGHRIDFPPEANG
jgi:hypothetical protein